MSEMSLGNGIGAPGPSVGRVRMSTALPPSERDSGSGTVARWMSIVPSESMDIFELKRRYGKVLSFHGGIGVQSVLPFGTVDEVRDMVRKTIDVMADGGGYLCSTSHTVRHEIPPKNLIAFVETVREYGEPPALETGSVNQ